MAITSLGSDEVVKVEAFIPRNEQYKAGVISPVSLSAQIEEVMELAKVENGYTHQIIKMERLKKKSDTGWVDSLAIKVIFSGRELPTGIKVGHSYYRVRPYVAEPTQCYNCLRMGHRSGSCTAKTRCLLCGRAHNRKECKSGFLQCVHCKGMHTANSKGCPIIMEARKIERIRAYQDETYKEARRQVIENRGRLNVHSDDGVLKQVMNTIVRMDEQHIVE